MMVQAAVEQVIASLGLQPLPLEGDLFRQNCRFAIAHF
jgi:hypothetical protein